MSNVTNWLADPCTVHTACMHFYIITQTQYSTLLLQCTAVCAVSQTRWVYVYCPRACFHMPSGLAWAHGVAVLCCAVSHSVLCCAVTSHSGSVQCVYVVAEMSGDVLIK
jgi:hypothetical protein